MDLKRNAIQLVEDIDETLNREYVPILEKELFRDGAVTLPTSVSPFSHEDNVKHAVAYALEQFGPMIEGKIKGEQKAIDILLEPSTNFRLGIECKTYPEYIKIKQLHNYAKKMGLSAIYSAFFALGNFERSLESLNSTITGESRLQKWNKEAFADRSRRVLGMTGLDKDTGLPLAAAMQKKYSKSEEAKKEMELKIEYIREFYRDIWHVFPRQIRWLGPILYNPLGKFVSTEPAVREGFTILAPGDIREESEARIKYEIWKYFRDKEYIVSTESVLPNAIDKKTTEETRYRKIANGLPLVSVQTYVDRDAGVNRPDITAIPKSQVNMLDLDKLDVVAVECKAKGKATKRNDLSDRLKEQIDSYKNSGDVSRIYVGVPIEDAYKIEKIVSQKRLFGEDYSFLGILGVDKTGDVEKIREAARIPLREPFYFDRYEIGSVEDTIFRDRIYIKQIESTANFLN